MKRIITNILEYVNTHNLNDNFWKWFSGSKIKKNGNPLVLYHGTKTKFDTFKLSKSKGNQGEDDQIEGIYLTDDKIPASFFSLDDSKDFIIEVFASIKNPYITKSHKTLKKELNIKYLSQVYNHLIKLGYDGIIIENGFYAYGGPYKLYLAFYPNQVKSVNNNGEWNIKNDNIYR